MNIETDSQPWTKSDANLENQTEEATEKTPVKPSRGEIDHSGYDPLFDNQRHSQIKRPY